MKVLKFSEKIFQNPFRFHPPTETSFGDQPSISQFIFTFFISENLHRLKIQKENFVVSQKKIKG
jgi:hypothetical protein